MRQLFLVMAVLAATTQTILAGESFWKIPQLASGWPDCVGKFCCDDYRPKPAPCVTGKTRFTCPDYCSKPLLRVSVGKKSFFGDDYCPKPVPPTCCLSAKNLRCISSHSPQEIKSAASVSSRDRRKIDSRDTIR